MNSFIFYPETEYLRYAVAKIRISERNAKQIAKFLFGIAEREYLRREAAKIRKVERRTK